MLVLIFFKCIWQISHKSTETVFTFKNVNDGENGYWSDCSNIFSSPLFPASLIEIIATGKKGIFLDEVNSSCKKKTIFQLKNMESAYLSESFYSLSHWCSGGIFLFWKQQRKKKDKKKVPLFVFVPRRKKKRSFSQSEKKCQEKILQEQIMRNNMLRAVLGSWSQK